MGITTDLARDLYGIQALAGRDVEQLHTLIIDLFAATYAGYRQNKAFNEAVEAVVLPQCGAEESTVFLQKRRYPARLAAFMNSIYGHGAELDDGHKKAAGHVGVYLIPAVFALAEKLGSCNDDVLIALATGYEAYIRISSAAQPGLVERGFHSTGMAGTLAAAAGCARLYRLDAAGIENAIALATTMAGGLLSYGDSRPAMKPLNPGKAAENGVFAAMLAAAGVLGPTESLEGQNGWFHAVTDHVDLSCLSGSDHLLLHDCYFKRYPSCRHTHGGIDAGVLLHDRVRPEQIEKVRVYVYPNAVKLAGIRVPKDQDETKFSIQYTLACALLNGSYGVADMDPPRLTKEVTELIGKTELIPDDSMEDRAKGIRGTRVAVDLSDGRTEEEVVLVPKGDPENPLSREDILEKLRVCAAGYGDGAYDGRLAESVLQIEGRGAFVHPMRYYCI